jgi:hypothetical protein
MSNILSANKQSNVQLQSPSVGFGFSNYFNQINYVETTCKKKETDNEYLQTSGNMSPYGFG